MQVKSETVVFSPFSGVYIGECHYYRQGEKSLDNLYKPFHFVEYFRYIRFFADGEWPGFVNLQRRLTLRYNSTTPLLEATRFAVIMQLADGFKYLP